MGVGGSTLIATRAGGGATNPATVKVSGVRAPLPPLGRAARARLQTLRGTPALWVLTALLIAGALLRVLLVQRDRPGFLGYPDTGAYLLDATDPHGVFFDPLRIIGYGFFLRVMSGVSDELFTVMVLQHVLGLATAALLYGAARRAGVRSRWAAVPAAAVVLLGGAQLLFEHAILSEALWTFLITACVYAVVRAQAAGAASGRVPWSVVAGALFAGSMLVRLPSVFFAPVLLVWLAAFAHGGRRGRALAVLPAVVVALVGLGLFRAEHEDQTGRAGFTRNGVMNVYGRVAPWADCTRFTPPAGTRFLCETAPVEERAGHDAYIFSRSPAVNAYGVGGVAAALPPEGARLIARWSRAAILGQPLTYLKAVAYESRRLVDHDIAPGLPGQTAFGFGQIAAGYPPLLQSTERDVFITPLITAGWPKTGGDRKGVAFFEGLESATRPPPLVFAAVYALLLVAIPAARGPERRAALLFVPLAVFGLLGPIFSAVYDWRYVVPMFGFAAAAAGIGGWAVIVATGGRLAARRRT